MLRVVSESLTLHTQSLINCVEQYGWMSWMATNREFGAAPMEDYDCCTSGDLKRLVMLWQSWLPKQLRVTMQDVMSRCLNKSHRKYLRYRQSIVSNVESGQWKSCTTNTLEC